MEVLIVESSKAIRSKLQNSIETQVNIPVYAATDLESARAIVQQQHNNIDLAIVDIHLPEANDDELLDLFESEGIPVVVLATVYNEKLRQTLLARQVIDYLIKGKVDVVSYVVELTQRLFENPSTTILVVDDDEQAGGHLLRQLQLQRYQVELVTSRETALERLESDTNIEMLITDVRSPEVDAAELVLQARELKGREELAIIVIPQDSGVHESIAPRVLKAGANDCLGKPFSVEEFNSRINQNIDLVRLSKKIRDSSMRDHLSGVFNRRYLYETARGLYANARRGNGSLAIAMLDIDHMKQINERYGNQAGDLVITHIASTIVSSIRQSDILARYGDEVFCLLLNDASSEHLYKIMDDIRSRVENTRVIAGNSEIRFTTSVGVTNHMGENLDRMLTEADLLLHKAKQNGRNNVQAHIE